MPLIVRFKRPADWRTSINIHYWETSPVDPPTTWPGVAMTAEANDWFVYTFPTANAASIVFNDGAGRQTGNLRRDADGWYYTNNTWYALNPERPQIRSSGRRRGRGCTTGRSRWSWKAAPMPTSSGTRPTVAIPIAAPPALRRGRGALHGTDHSRSNDHDLGRRRQLGE